MWNFMLVRIRAVTAGGFAQVDGQLVETGLNKPFEALKRSFDIKKFFSQTVYENIN